MKLKLTDNQHKLLLEFQKRAYSFDWDDNILFMPTKVYLDKRAGKGWVPVSVSTEEFAQIRGDIGKNFRYRDNSIAETFKDFRSYESFINDTKEALSKNAFGPSFNKFKEALINTHDFSIITARGNPPTAIKDSIKLIISDTLSDGEKETMENNLGRTTVEQYLSLQDYYPVMSDDFMKEFDTEAYATEPEMAKTVALRSFVDRIIGLVERIKDDPEFTGVSIGYSDDDIDNVEYVESFIESTLNKLYPDISFLVYDTSDPNKTKKKRIIIKK